MPAVCLKGSLNGTSTDRQNRTAALVKTRGRPWRSTRDASQTISLSSQISMEPCFARSALQLDQFVVRYRARDGVVVRFA